MMKTNDNFPAPFLNTDEDRYRYALLVQKYGEIDARVIAYTRADAARMLATLPEDELAEMPHAAFSVAVHLLMNHAWGDRELAFRNLEYFIGWMRAIITRGTVNTDSKAEDTESGEEFCARCACERVVTTVEIAIDEEKARADNEQKESE